MSGYFGIRKSVGGYTMDEVASALQKSIRRSDEEGAMFWASELDLSGFGNYCWKRLRVIASEDIGIADPLVAIQVRTLFENWREGGNFEQEEFAPQWRGWLMHAVILLARAPKSRLVDHATIGMYMGERPKREIPDYALDKHTTRGRGMGRDAKHFMEVASDLQPAPAIEDPYQERAKEILLGDHPLDGNRYSRRVQRDKVQVQPRLFDQ